MHYTTDTDTEVIVNRLTSFRVRSCAERGGEGGGRSRAKRLWKPSTDARGPRPRATREGASADPPVTVVAPRKEKGGLIGI